MKKHDEYWLNTCHVLLYWAVKSGRGMKKCLLKHFPDYVKQLGIKEKLIAGHLLRLKADDKTKTNLSFSLSDKHTVGSMVIACSCAVEAAGSNNMLQSDIL